MRLIVAGEPHPKIEVDAERIQFHVDPVDANNVDAGINDALYPVVSVAERDDMALLSFRGEIDSFGLIDAHELQRRSDEQTVTEETQSNRAAECRGSR